MVFLHPIGAMSFYQSGQNIAFYSFIVRVGLHRFAAQPESWIMESSNMPPNDTAQVRENAISPTAKIKFGEKLSYFLLNFGSDPLGVVLSTYLLIFYTDVVGLDPGALVLLFLLARIVDAVTDPIMGYFIDHLPRTKWGRFRPWLVTGGLLACINYLLVWLGPSMAMGSKLLIAYVSYLLIGITMDMLEIPRGSLLPAMTESTRERNTLSILKAISMTVAPPIFLMITVPFVSAFPTPKAGWYTLILGIAVFAFVLLFVGTLGVRERVQPVKKESYPLSQLLKIFFKTKPLVIIFISVSFVMVSIAVRMTSIIYYLTYVFKDANLMILLTGLSLVSGLIGTVVMPLFANRYEKKNVMFATLVIMGLGSLGIFFVPTGNVVLLCVFYTIMGFGSGVLPLFYSISADIVDYVEWQHQYRAEGAVSSLFGFVMKVAGGFGAAIPAFILSITGYVANAEQPPQSLQGILHTVSTIPFAFILIGALILLAYPISPSVFEKIIAELAQRRAEEAK
jgi:sugar (glycoside-pentoside-hexuronide) transporter